jgi:hypothetical protein
MPLHLRQAGPLRLAALAALTLAVALALVLIARANAGSRHVETSVANVPTPKADAVDAIDFPCTTSATFVPMPTMSRTFKLGGKASQPVLVLFQGEWFGFDSGQAAQLELTVDGVVQPGPGTIITIDQRPAGTTQPVSTHGFDYVTSPLAPGTHTAEIEWRSTPGGQICVTRRSLVVMHK